ncbi:MAG: CpsD/CapB family tyrosine-protein kinase [Phycisphaerae bacterium]|nr:CpsD/CapB family tyrosine-protein kinase [Phycisphaerae bacterium]
MTDKEDMFEKNEPNSGEEFLDEETPFESPVPDVDPDPIADLGNLSGDGPVISSATRGAKLAPRSSDMFHGMWASIFYSGRTTGKMVLVTSAARREGVSTIACGLGLTDSDVEGSPRVALVDFNLRNPAIHRMLGLREGPGLVEALADGLSPAEGAQKVNRNLDVFTVGAIGSRSLEVLRSDAVETFFAQLDEIYDYILVDSAAANHYPDAQVLGGVLKDVVIVVHSDFTPREAVAQAKKRIEAGGGRVAGIVLNMRTFPIPNFLYRIV